MARIRNVKPEFFRHESLQDLEQTHPQERPMLVYAGLWTQCSKNGVFKWKPRSLKLDILPFLDFDMGNALAILERHGFIIRFSKDGEEYGYIPKFLEHQAISHKEKDAPSTYPDYVETQPGTVPEQSRNSSRPYPDTADIGHRTYDIGQRKEGTAPQASPVCVPRFKKPSVDEVRAYCQERKNRVDPQAFVDFYEAKGWKIGKNPMKDWQASVRTWEKRDDARQPERREIDYPEPSPPPPVDEETARKNAEILRGWKPPRRTA